MADDPGPFTLLSIMGAVMSDESPPLHRYWLWRIWSRSLPILVVCMFNPSTADARDDDPTIKRLCAFARAWGYGGILVINLRSYRTADPDECKAWARRHAATPSTTLGRTLSTSRPGRARRSWSHGAIWRAPMMPCRSMQPLPTSISSASASTATARLSIHGARPQSRARRSAADSVREGGVSRIVANLPVILFVIGSACFLVGNAILLVRGWRP
jgi:hypothetical protein